MTHTETGLLLTILIISTVVHGVCTLIASVLYVWLWSMLSPVLATDDKQTVCAKIARRYRYHMAGLAAIGCLAVCLASGGMIVHLGTVHRDGDGHRTNWSYFGVGESVAFATLGGIIGVFFWFPSVLQCLILAALWMVSCILLGAGGVYSETNQRLFCFLASIILQAVSGVFLFCAASGLGGVLRSGRGLVAFAKLICAAVLFDVFWYIGYLNSPQAGVHIDTRWVSHLVFFIASVIAHICLPMWTGWFYTTESEQAVNEMGYARQPLSPSLLTTAEPPL